MSFLTPLEMTPAPGNKWKLTDDLHYGTDDGFLIRIPKGFLTDLASIPRVLRLFIPVNGRHRQAAVLHDFLYSRKGRVVLRTYTREEADMLFFKAMIQTGVNPWKARTMYFGVRIGGWASWG